MTTISHTSAAFVDHAALNADDVATTNQSQSNSVAAADPSHQSASSSPTDGAREETKPLTHKEIEQLSEERAMENPDYAKLKEQLESCSGLEEMFHLIDKNVGWRNDDKITMDDILALVNDTNQPNKELRAAAKWLNDHGEILSALKKDDNLIGLHDVKNFISGLKAQLKDMKDSARADIKAEHTVQTPAQTAATNAPSSGAAANGAAATTTETDPKKLAAKAIMDEAEKSLPKPAPSQFAGMEGASENMNNMIGWAEAETDRLTTLMGKTDDPAVLKQLETKINQMSRRMQQMTALMNQLMTAMQNISKMYSDIAMNSVRNMR